MDFKDYTKDELNDACARSYPDLNLKTSWSKNKMIKEIKNYFNKLGQDVKEFFKSEEKIIPPQILITDEIKCHRCRNTMVLIDKINNDYRCPKCGTNTTVMAVF